MTVTDDALMLQTMFSSIIINHLQQKYSTHKCSVICLYLNHKERSSQTYPLVMGSLIKQLLQLQKSSPLPKDIVEWYDLAKTTKSKPHEKKIPEALKKLVNSYDRVFLVVDALDECDFRQRLVAELQALPAGKLSLMITSRPIDGEERDDAVDCALCKDEDVELYFDCSICDISVCSNCEEKDDNPCKKQAHTLAEPSDRVEVILKTPPEDIRQYVEHEIGKEVRDYGSKLYDNRRYSSRASRPNATRLGRINCPRVNRPRSCWSLRVEEPALLVTFVFCSSKFGTRNHNQSDSDVSTTFEMSRYRCMCPLPSANGDPVFLWSPFTVTFSYEINERPALPCSV